MPTEPETGSAIASVINAGGIIGGVATVIGIVATWLTQKRKDSTVTTEDVYIKQGMLLKMTQDAKDKLEVSHAAEIAKRDKEWSDYQIKRDKELSDYQTKSDARIQALEEKVAALISQNHYYELYIATKNLPPAPPWNPGDGSATFRTLKGDSP